MERNEIYKHIDYTLLKPTTTKKDIDKLCNTAITKDCASVCIPSSYVKYAHEHFPSINICTVVGFPLGNCSTATKVAEAKEAIKNGANEIDMVINIGMLKDANYKEVFEEIDTLRMVVGTSILKVIIETCYLTDKEIAIASNIVSASADYVKTSTGFGSRGASFHDIEIIKRNLNYFTKIKASGGIRTLEDMEKYIEMGCDRIGASCLP